MSARLEELDWRETPMGELSLRRRLEPALQIDVYEVRLGDEFLMSSLFTVAEIELARLGLAATSGPDLDVLVGGLGLGYTAQAALEDPRVRRLTVIEAQPAVIEWHQRQLLPVSSALTDDPRCELVEADFFAGIATSALGVGGFGPEVPERWHAILLDIDHTPHHLLHPSHAGFYTAAGLERLACHLHPHGVFALWSDDPPDEAFLTLLRQSFTDPTAHVVTFPNHYTDIPSTNTVYVARRD
ncbi:MAG: spermidine synthase [Propionibacteriaceae bacterium]